MKICLVSTVYPPRIGGPSTQTRQLALLLKEHQVTPVVVTFGERNEVRYDEGIKVYYLHAHEEPVIGPFLQYLNALFRLRAIFRREKPDVVHHQNGVNFLCVISGFLARRLGIPSLVKYAGDLVWERLGAKSSNSLSYEEIFNSSLKAKLLTLIERFALHNFTSIWATSRFQKDSLTRILGIDAKKIICHPNYVVLDDARSPKTPSEKITILSVCRFARWKRIDNTLRAFAKLKRDNIRLMIVGGENPDLERELRGLAGDLKISEQVEFVGSISPVTINEVFKSADIFVSSTTYEPFGIVFLEAMAMGLPIVTTNVGGIAEVVPEGQAGFLVEPYNIDEMVAKLRLVIDDPSLRAQLGEGGRKWAKQFDLRDQMPVFIGLYRNLKNLNKQGMPLTTGIADKKSLYTYYKAQREDCSRMYKERYREHKQRRRLDIIKKILAGYGHDDALIFDVGCGDGYAASFILDGWSIRAYLGLDLSRTKLKGLLQRVECSKAIVGDGEELPFVNKSFDIVLCLETLEHLLDPHTALKEIKRVLKPAGICLISIPVDSSGQKILIQAIKKLRKKKTSNFNEHVQLFTLNSTDRVLRECGFKVLSKRACGFNLPLFDLVASYLPYRISSWLDNLLCRIPLQSFGVGTKFTLAIGREYLVLAVQKA